MSTSKTSANEQYTAAEKLDRDAHNMSLEYERMSRIILDEYQDVKKEYAIVANKLQDVSDSARRLCLAILSSDMK